MAEAPRPGVGAREEALEAAQEVLRVRLRDETFDIAANNVSLRVKDRFIRETGRAAEWYFAPERQSDVTLCGLWFLARLIDGQDVTWDQMLDEWDAAAFTAEDIDVEQIAAGESTSPEV